jgi:hypothetical protein
MASASHYLRRFTNTLTRLIDRSVLLPLPRWTLLTVFLSLTLYRLLVYRYLLVTLVLSFYCVYFVLQFFTPAGINHSEGSYDISMQMKDRVDIGGRIERDRPLIRSLNEFNLWKQLGWVGLVGLFCTIFEFLAVEVNPLYLALYFLWLCWLAWERHQKNS